MKRYLPLFFGVAISFFGSSQNISSYTLDFNNVAATVNDGGVFLNYPTTGLHGCEIPSGSQLHTIFAMSFWYGGVDVNGQLKLSAQQYTPFDDQFRGPLTADGTATAPSPGPGAWSNSLFPITQPEITAHLANYMNPGYVPTSNIANWPAHGDISLNFDYYLAPFVDTDGDGVYDPLAGDYPCMRGDQAVYVIMNDKRFQHASGGDPIGIEMHYMFYEYSNIPEIKNTTFVSAKVINRGTQTLEDFKVSVFMDGDIGYSGDDYFGSDSTRNLMYFYNGDNFDETAAATSGYGNVPPATGIISLSNNFESIGSLVGLNPITGMAANYWNLMNANNVNGTAWTDPITGNPTNFMYASDPSDVSQPNSEVALANTPGERRGVASINIETLVPFSEHTFDYAVIYNRDTTDNIDNAAGLKNVADIIQNFFDTTIDDDCLSNSVGITEHDDVDFSIYPNPSSGQFTLTFETNFPSAEIEIYDISGRSVLARMELKSNESNIEVDQPAGVYLLHLIVDGRESVKRIILE